MWMVLQLAAANTDIKFIESSWAGPEINIAMIELFELIFRCIQKAHFSELLFSLYWKTK